MRVGYLPSLYESAIQQGAFANDVNFFLRLLNLFVPSEAYNP
jgi:hypothetical protein